MAMEMRLLGRKSNCDGFLLYTKLFVAEETVNVYLNQGLKSACFRHCKLVEKGQDQGSKTDTGTIIDLLAMTGTDDIFWLCQLNLTRAEVQL